MIINEINGKIRQIKREILTVHLYIFFFMKKKTALTTPCSFLTNERYSSSVAFIYRLKRVETG